MIISGIGIHDTDKMVVTAHGSQGAAWVSLRHMDSSETLVCIFLKGDDAMERAQRLAAAINKECAHVVR